GQPREWNHDTSLDWHLADEPLHGGLMRWVRDLNALYRENEALWNDEPGGFDWIDFSDRDHSTIAYERRAGDARLAHLLNFTPVPRQNYRIGVPENGTYIERLNSDAEIYGGSGLGNYGSLETTPVPYHGYPASVVVTIPPLAVLVLAKGEDAS